MDSKIKNLINKTLNQSYIIDVNNNIYDIINECLISPVKIYESISLMYDIGDDMANLIIFNWLYFNGYQDIIKTWNYIKNNVHSFNNGKYILGCDTANQSDTNLTIVYEYLQ